MASKTFAAFVTMMLLASGLFATVAQAQPATPTTVTVTDEEIVRQAEDSLPTASWVLYTRYAGTGEVAEGPGAPPIGSQSMHFSTPAGTDKAFLANFDWENTPISSINAFSYSTYRTSGDSPNQVPSLNIVLDYNGADTGGFTTLVFEPVYNTNQGTITDGIWQSWDAYSGGNATWWSSKEIPGVCAFDCFVSWNTIVTNNPSAVILGGVGINQGSGNPALIAAADALTIGTANGATTYDFDIVSSGELLDNLSTSTEELVDNPGAERALLASLNRTQQFLDAGQPVRAYFSMLQYVMLLNRYDRANIISDDAAQQLYTQALDLTRSFF
jgi:hypothetical protein